MEEKNTEWGFPYSDHLLTNEVKFQKWEDCNMLWETCFREKCFNNDEKLYGKIGRLLGELQMFDVPYDLSLLLNGETEKEVRGFFKIRPVPNIVEIDPYYRKLAEAENELHKLSHLTELLKSESKKDYFSTEIQIKLERGIGNKTISIKDKKNLSLILEQLNQLPKGKQIEKRGRGNPEQRGKKEFMKHAVKRCFELIEPISPELSEREKLFFSGIVLSFAGILAPPRVINKGDQIEPHQITDLKEWYWNELKGYKSTGK